MLYYQLLKDKNKFTTIEKNKLDQIISILSKSKIYFSKSDNKKINLKNKKNNFNMILNKLTNSNYKEILIEEINNKNINNSNIFKLINLLLIKVENEGKFNECYSNFLIDIVRIISREGDELIIYNTIAKKFEEILYSSDELRKDSFYNFIKILIDKGFFFKTLVKHIMDLIKLKENKYYDFYLWVKLNKNLQKIYKNEINENINKLTKLNNIRLVTLYETLKGITIKSTKRIYNNNNNNINNNNNNNKKYIKCKNTINEYLLLEDIEEIKYFIKENNSNNIIESLEDVILHEIMINEERNFNKLINLLKKHKLFNLLKIKHKIKKMKYDSSYLDFKERCNIITKL